MAKLTMRQVREMRRGIIEGKTVKQLASKYGVSETTVRNYTKAIRIRIENYERGSKVETR